MMLRGLQRKQHFMMVQVLGVRRVCGKEVEEEVELEKVEKMMEKKVEKMVERKKGWYL
jgi:hypothetical protein